MKVSKEEYEKALKDYDRVGEELDDAKENGSGQSKIESLRRELKSLENMIHAHEHDYELEKFDVTGVKNGERVVISKEPVSKEDAEGLVADAIKSGLYGDVKLSPTVNESYKQKVHRYSYPKGYKKLKHVKLFENFDVTEGTRTITEPVILLAIRSKSADEFKKELEAYKEENPDTYTSDVIDAQHRLGLPLNAENDPKLIYDKAKSIQA